MPGRVLRDVQVPVQLHGLDRLQAGHEQIDGHGPHLVAQVGVLHDGSAAHREALAAVAAAERHRLVLGAGLDAVGAGAAMRALPSVWPANADTPLLGGSVMREHAHGLDHADALACAPAPCFLARHPSSSLHQIVPSISIVTIFIFIYLRYNHTGQTGCILGTIPHNPQKKAAVVMSAAFSVSGDHLRDHLLRNSTAPGVERIVFVAFEEFEFATVRSSRPALPCKGPARASAPEPP